MNQEMLNVLVEAMENGGDVPAAQTAQKRYEVTVHLFRIIFEQNAGIAEALHDVRDGMKKIEQSPSLLYLFRYHTIKFVAVLGGMFVFMLAFWLALYAVVQIPGVREWLHLIIGFPLPPI